MGTITDITKYAKDEEFLYMMLSRLKMDCEYYLGYGNRNKNILWADDEKKHINEMKAIHNYLDPKPEWLSMGKIEEYEILMVN